MVLCRCDVQQIRGKEKRHCFPELTACTRRTKIDPVGRGVWAVGARRVRRHERERVFCPPRVRLRAGVARPRASPEGLHPPRQHGRRHREVRILVQRWQVVGGHELLSVLQVQGLPVLQKRRYQSLQPERLSRLWPVHHHAVWSDIARGLLRHPARARRPKYGDGILVRRAQFPNAGDWTSRTVVADDPRLVD